MAQLGARFHGMEEVTGSIPVRSTKTPLNFYRLRTRITSSFGLSEPWQTLRETPLTHSFCKHAVARRAPLLIPDTTKDPVFKDNPASRELAVVAYAGIPLEVGGQPLGAFCVVDHEPRAWSSEEVQMLEDLAQCVTHEIDLRTRLRETEDAWRDARGFKQ